MLRNERYYIYYNTEDEVMLYNIKNIPHKHIKGYEIMACGYPTDLMATIFDLQQSYYEEIMEGL